MIAFNLHLVAHTLALKLPQAGVRGMNVLQMGNMNSTPHANVSPEMEKSSNDMAPAQNYLKSVQMMSLWVGMEETENGKNKRFG